MHSSDIALAADKLAGATDVDKLYALSAAEVADHSAEDLAHTSVRSDSEIAGVTTEEDASQLGNDRRHFLREIGAVAAAAATTALLPTSAVTAESNTAVAHHLMRSTKQKLADELAAASHPTTSQSGQPLVPSLAIVALNRMGFGPLPGDIEAFAALGATADEQFATYVEQQTNPADIDDSECDAKLAEQGFITLDSSIQELWATYVKPTVEDPEYDRYKPLREVRTATFLRGLHSKRQLFELLTDFWHNHFNVYGWDYWIAPAFSQYDRDVIRPNVFGNFREMLETVSQSPAMLYFLDNQSNEGGNPNENYARELFELHGMGAENYLGVRDPNDPDLFDENGDRIGYIDDDVYGSTTCFTGWRVDPDTGVFGFDDSLHFPFQKVVLGQVFPSFQGIKDGRDVLDLIASHPGTARHICRKLCRRLVTDDPSETLVQSAADIFFAQQDAPDQIKQVVQHILLSDEFKTSWGKKIKRPFEFTLSILRSTNADFDPSDDFYWWYEQMGQGLFRWQPPNGYPDSRIAWSSSMPMVQRWRFANKLIRWDYGDESEQMRLDFGSQTPSSVNTPKAIVDYWANRILGRALPPEEHLPILEYVAQGRNPDFELPAEDRLERLPYTIGLICMSPSFQWK